MNERDDFFERLRADAAPLRHQPDPETLLRIRTRIAERLAPRVTVAQLLAAWLRPVAATMAAIAVAAGIGIATFTVRNNSQLTYVDAVEIVMGGETYSVGR
jgi:hypothetical protein